MEWSIRGELPGWTLSKEGGEQDFVVVKLRVHGDSPVVWKMPDGHTVDSSSIKLVTPSGTEVSGSFLEDGGAAKFASVTEPTRAELPPMVYIVPKSATQAGSFRVRSLKMPAAELTAATRRE